RRRKPPPGARRLDGWLVVDKPLGLTSARVVAMLRASWRPLRIGHAGTLDPLASGVLPVALGEATKTVAYAMTGEKSYRFTLAFGQSRSTDDAEGEVTGESPVRPQTNEIMAILPRFIGSVRQRPPVFSALKVAGQRAYDLARAGKSPELGERIIKINRLELIERPDAETATFAVDCGKGTYVRALARDIALALGGLGHVSALRRTRVGPFTESGAIALDNLVALGHSAAAFEHLLPVETALDDIPALALTGDQAALLRQGRAVAVLGTGGLMPRNGDAALAAAFSDGTVVCAKEGTKPVALARYSGGSLFPVRVLNL
ncbi:MAG: tRNA pseudouridine synthase, partial [Pseudomonadota bacterium]